MARLNARVNRLEQQDDRYCTLGEIFDAIEAEERGETPLPLRPFDPSLTLLLAQIDKDVTPSCDKHAAQE